MALDQAIKPIKTPGLYDAAAAGGVSFDDWNKLNGLDGAMPTIAPAQINDSVADNVAKLTNQNSALNTVAKTMAAQGANRRGLQNSSIAQGAAMAEVTKAALPIAQQDAAQAAAKNAAARGFEYAATLQDDSQSFEQKMQAAGLEASEAAQIRDIASREGLAAADRALQDTMQQRQIGSSEKMGFADIESREGLATAQRALEVQMQNAALSEAEQAQIRDITSREGMAGADRALQTMLQQKDIDFKATEAEKDRVLQSTMQDKTITAQDKQAALDRSAQKTIASWNLASSDRNAAAQFVSNTEGMYQNHIQSIMNNTALTAAQRTAQLTSAKSLYNSEMSLVRQIYNVKLTWSS